MSDLLSGFFDHFEPTSEFYDHFEPARAEPAVEVCALRDIALAAVAATIEGDEHFDDDTGERRLLREAQQRADPWGRGWTEGFRESLDRARPDDAALVALARDLGLTFAEILAVALAAAVEDDLMVGRMLAHIQAPIGGSRPVLGLLSAAFGPVAEEDHPILAIASGEAVRTGLLVLTGESEPIPERAVAVAPYLAFALTGRDGACPGVSVGSGKSVPLPPSLVAEARQRAAGLAATPGASLALRTASIAEGRAVAGTIAAALGARPAFIDTQPPPGFGIWLRLRRLVPVFRVDPAPGERTELPPLPGYDGPLLAVSGPDGAVAAAGATVPSWRLPVPEPAEREALWAAAIDDQELAHELANRHRYGSGRIAFLGRLAHQALAERAGEGQPAAEDIATAAWTAEGGGLDGLALPVPQGVPDAALVVPTALRRDLELLEMRCRGREGLAEGLGPSVTARFHPGVRALFVGPSGTGKTLAGGWLATRLGLPLYRVDLASITSKYIGETEKHLAQLLARAEEAEVVLLFDEADTLFGRRTDVQEANDRFANAQTNYLLQRIETFDGITILTSNSRSRFDEAFTRRLDAIVEFALPGPRERREMWAAHLGDGHTLTPDDLNRLAAMADVGGGYIRNAVLAAAVLARGEGGAITLPHLLRGLEAEYRKLGRQLPPVLRTAV